MRRAAIAWTSGGLAAVLALAAGPARAANEEHVRTPVLWPSQCGLVLDRALDDEPAL